MGLQSQEILSEYMPSCDRRVAMKGFLANVYVLAARCIHAIVQFEPTDSIRRERDGQNLRASAKRQ